MNVIRKLILNTPLLKTRFYVNNKFRFLRSFTTGHNVCKSIKTKSQENMISNPIGFFGSKAESWRARDTYGGGADTYVWYQPYVISASLSVFLIYFCILREENDIDRKLEGNLFDKVKGLEEVTLVLNYKYNREHGLDTRDIEQRMLELGLNAKDIK